MTVTARNDRRWLAGWTMMLCLALAWMPALAQSPQEDEVIELKNDHLSMQVHPRWGGRASELIDLKTGHNFVQEWRLLDTGRDAGTMRGGVFRSIISGSYYSTQPNTAYRVVSQSPRSIKMHYVTPPDIPLLNGLEETRTLTLSDDEPVVTLQIEVVNRSDEPRPTYYRVQDWTGVGQKRGRDTVYLTPSRTGRQPVIHMASSPQQVLNDYHLWPSASWYAMADLVNDVALFVEVRDQPVAMTYFWGSGTSGVSFRTAEFFLPQAILPPGGKVNYTVTYRVYRPSSPQTGHAELDTVLATHQIDEQVRIAAISQPARPLPYDAQLRLPEQDALTIQPVHPTARSLYTDAPTPAGPAGLTLGQVHLAGTPGEIVPLAIRLEARAPRVAGTLTFTDLAHKRRRIAASAFDPRYVSTPAGFLVKEWLLAREVPETMGGINNDVRDAETFSPFVLNEGETGIIWTYLRVPADARAGVYHGQAKLNLEGGRSVAFDIDLTVRPFTLQKAPGKHYGGFFRYRLNTEGLTEKNSEYGVAISREAYLETLKSLKEAGYNSLVIYVGQRDDLLWVLDQCVNLGWTDGTFVLINTNHVTAELLKERYGKYPKMTILGWGVDEPTRYAQIEKTRQAYNRLLARHFEPVFTPNVPLGLLITDSLPKIVPIMALSGNAPYAFKATRDYRDAGRKAYWYTTDMAEPELEKRLIRGVYFWKEPVNGILDWGEDAMGQKLSVHKLAGFAGDRVISTVGRENIAQGLIDLQYLHTLETHIQKSRNKEAIAQANEFLKQVRQRFHDDWHEVARDLRGPAYLDVLREQITQHIQTLDAR